MEAIATTDAASGLVCASLCMSVIPVIPAKMVEPIKMPFQRQNHVGGKNHVLDGERYE